jgi:outer membrane lipoprotein-sorting protein
LVIFAVLAAFIIPAAQSAAAPTAESLIGLARKNFAAIRDYSVDIRLDVKSDAIDVKGMAMTLYYKKPDKTRIVAKEGFAAMPRSVALGNVIDEVTKHCIPVLEKTEKKNGIDCYVIRLEPMLRGSKPPTTLWLDKSGLIRAINMGGPYPVRTEWRYAKVDEKYDLPRRIDVRIASPASGPYPRHRGRRPEVQPVPAGGVQTVNATLSFSNYKVNKGIRDSVFEPESPKK